MRVYLACTVRGNRGTLATVRAICGELERHGHEVLTTHLVADDVEAGEARLGEAAVFERDLDWLAACEAVVAEASGSSYGVGFEVGYVLGRSADTGQRVFLLYDVARRDGVSRLIPGNTHPRCVTFGYRDTDEAVAFIARHFGGGRS